MNTSYTDVLEMTPIEREYLIGFLLEDYNEKKKAAEQELQALQQQKEARSK